jgi:hypothetical protein
MKRGTRVYLSAPYSADTPEERLANTRRAMALGFRLIQMGFSPYVPHLSHYVDEMAKAEGETITYQEWLDYDCEWLLACDAILAPLARSPGVEHECRVASLNGIPEFDSIESLVAWDDTRRGVG